MSYFYGRIADYEGLFEMDQDGVVRPCDVFKQGYVGHLLSEGHTVDILSSCKTRPHPLYDCAGRKHFVLHKHYDRTFYHNVSDDTVWCLLNDQTRVFHPAKDECPLTAFLQLAMKKSTTTFTLWNKIMEEYEGVRKAEHGWTVFAPSAVPGYPADERNVPNIDCSHYALTRLSINGAS